MIIKSLELGPLDTNCYIVMEEATGDCAVIDIGGDASTLLDYLERCGAQLRCVFLTHGHFDHTGGVADVLAETGAQLYMSQRDNGITIGGNYYKYTAPEGTQFFSEGEVISLGSISFTVMETPGHTPGSVTLLCRDAADPEGMPALFTGDTLFRDSCGRTDFPGSDPEAMMKSLRRLSGLPGDYEVYPGHMEATTLERERRFNYFINAAIRG